MEASKSIGGGTGEISRAVKNGWKSKGYQWRDYKEDRISPHSNKPKKPVHVKVGDLYSSDRYGDYEVIEFSHMTKGYKNNYYVRFRETGFIEYFDTHTISSGNAVDYMYPTVQGVGYLGSRNKTSKKSHDVWRMMIRRCYGEHESSHLYKDVLVDERWHNLQNFHEDITKIDGYDEVLVNSGKLVLDKDLKQKGKKNKIYSLKTCTFITTEENTSIKRKTTHSAKKFSVLTPEGDYHIKENRSKFSRECGFPSGTVTNQINKKRYKYKDWVFGLETMTKEDLINIRAGVENEKNV